MWGGGRAVGVGVVGLTIGKGGVGAGWSVEMVEGIDYVTTEVDDW